MHNPDDTDGSEIAVHHTLGTNAHQAMPGDVLRDLVVSDPPTSAQILEALTRLGAYVAST